MGYDVVKDQNTMTRPQNKTIPRGTFICPECGVELDEDGICPECGSQVKPVSMDAPDVKIEIAKMEERKELRQFINENIELEEADDYQAGDVSREMKAAGAKVASGVRRFKRYMSPEQRASRIQKRQRKHQYKATSHAIRAKRLGLKHQLMTSEDVEYNFDPEARKAYTGTKNKINYLKWRQKKLRRSYKYGN